MASIWMDGKFFDKEDACVPVYDHGLLYGDGIFEGISIYGGKPFKLREHMLRLYHGAKALRLDIPYAPQELTEWVLKTAAKEGLDRGYIRLVVTRGTGDLGLDPDKCDRARVIIIADTISLYPQKYYEEGIPIVTAPTRRVDANFWDPRIKSLNYLNNILAKMEAKQAGCMEAVMLNSQGYVTECTADNLFWLFEGTIHTPASHLGLLEGITRNSVIELAEKLDYPIKQGMYTRFDLYTAQEMFMTGSGAELMPIISVDQRTIGSGEVGPTFKKINSAFQKLVLKG